MVTVSPSHWLTHWLTQYVNNSLTLSLIHSLAPAHALTHPLVVLLQVTHFSTPPPLPPEAAAGPTATLDPAAQAAATVQAATSSNTRETYRQSNHHCSFYRSYCSCYCCLIVINCCDFISCTCTSISVSSFDTCHYSFLFLDVIFTKYCIAQIIRKLSHLPFFTHLQNVLDTVTLEVLIIMTDNIAMGTETAPLKQLHTLWARNEGFLLAGCIISESMRCQLSVLVSQWVNESVVIVILFRSGLDRNPISVVLTSDARFSLVVFGWTTQVGEKEGTVLASYVQCGLTHMKRCEDVKKKMSDIRRLPVYCNTGQ